MHINSKSIKVTAGALAVAAAVLGLAGCGSRGGGEGPPANGAPSTMFGSSQFDVGHTVE